MDKAPDAFRTISEVAEELDVPQHVLRFWETRFPHIKPMKRGGGRRYYRPDDVDLLRGIRFLLYGEGYTIRGVQRLLKDQGIKFVQSVWREDAPAPATVPADDADESEASIEDAPEDADATLDAETTVTPEPSRRPEPKGSRRDTSFGSAQRAASSLQRSGPVAASPQKKDAVIAPPKVAGFQSDDLQRLQAILAELGECRRLLDAALAEG